jgi:hypothetical protein
VEKRPFEQTPWELSPLARNPLSSMFVIHHTGSSRLWLGTLFGAPSPANLKTPARTTQTDPRLTRKTSPVASGNSFRSGGRHPGNPRTRPAPCGTRPIRSLPGAWQGVGRLPVQGQPF